MHSFTQEHETDIYITVLAQKFKSKGKLFRASNSDEII